MAKTIAQLQAEIEKKEAWLSQEHHKEKRLKNRLKYYEKGERGKRTHRLCNLGGTVESLVPEVKEMTRTEMYELIMNRRQTQTGIACRFVKCKQQDFTLGRKLRFCGRFLHNLGV